jgi:putative thioredoxin
MLNAVQYIENINLDHKYYDDAQHVRNISRFLVSEYKDNSEAAKLMKEAKFDILENDFESGIEKIIAVNKFDKSYQDDLPRLTAIALFEILGKNHELTKNYRKTFDMVLY